MEIPGYSKNYSPKKNENLQQIDNLNQTNG